MAPDSRSQSVKATIKWHEAWLAETDINGDVIGEWCTYQDAESARCTWCSCVFYYRSQGKSGMMKHATGRNHARIADGRKGRNKNQPGIAVTSAADDADDNDQDQEGRQGGGDRQEHVGIRGGGHGSRGGVAASRGALGRSVCGQIRSVPPVKAWSLNDTVDKAEAVMALKVVESNYSFISQDNMGDVLRKMIPNCPILQKYSMKRTKCSIVISHGLFPYFKKKLIEGIKSAPGYTLGTDAATFKQRGISKHVDIVIRYI